MELLVWAVFALVVMSPIGYVVTRTARRIGTRRRLAAVMPPRALATRHLPVELAELAENTRDVRVALERPLLVSDDYLAALTMLDIAVNLARTLGLRGNWATRMRDAYDAAVTGAREGLARWCTEVDAIGGEAGRQLRALGLSSLAIRDLLARSRGLMPRPAYTALATRDDVKALRREIPQLIHALDRFERVLTGEGGDPYR